MVHKNNLEIVACFKNAVVHSYSDGELIYSSKNKIYKIKNLHKPEPEIVGKIPWANYQKVSHMRIIDRILRHAILQVHKTRNMEYLVTTENKWWHIDRAGNVSPIEKFSNTQPMSRGICESKNGITYVAEYIPNPHRGPVRIFRSKDCRIFDIAWESPPRAIRHVHALIVDPELKSRLWITTGDLSTESHIYFTDDDFKTLNCFLSLDQKTRVADVIIQKNHMIWAPDAVRVASILRVNKMSPCNIEELHKLPGPVFYTAQNEAGILYFGTVPSKKQKEDNQSRIFALLLDNSCHEILRCKKSFLPLYGIFHFPKGILPENFIVFSQRGLKPFDGCLTIAKHNVDSKWI